MKRFRFWMLVIVGLVGLVVFLSFYMNHGFAEWAYPVTTIGGLVFLTAKAVRLHGDRRYDPIDLLCASENVQALGVFFLLASFAVSTSSLEKIDFYGDLSFKALKPLITPFVEGLLATGSATLLSTILRQYQVTKEGGGDSDDSDRAVSAGAGIAGSLKEILSPDDMQRIKNAFTAIGDEAEALKVSVNDVRMTMGLMKRDSEEACNQFTTLLRQVGVLVQDLNKFFVDERGTGTDPPHRR